MVSYVYLLSLLAVVLLPFRIGYIPIVWTTHSEPASDLSTSKHCSASATGSTAMRQDLFSKAYVEVFNIVELTISQVADDAVNNAKITFTTDANANDKKLINRDTISVDQASQSAQTHSQDMKLAQAWNTVGSDGSGVKSQAPDICSGNTQPLYKENEAPQSSELDVDRSTGFADWKGSGNPSHPKCDGPPCDVDPSGQDDQSASDVSTDRSRGICPGMGAWVSN